MFNKIAPILDRWNANTHINPDTGKQIWIARSRKSSYSEQPQYQFENQTTMTRYYNILSQS